MRRLILVAAAVLALAAFTAGPAGAAPNPSGQGQPGAECGDPGASSMPNGFDTGGFSNAESHYANSQNGNPHAVSQYDVACYQVTSSGH